MADTTPEPTTNSRVFVNNLAWATSWPDLKDHFRPIGEVIRADVLVGPDGRSKGCGIVEFATPELAAEAIARMNETELGGRSIVVREDREEGRGAAPGVARQRRAPFAAAGSPAFGRGRGLGRGGFAAPAAAPSRVRSNDPRRSVFVNNLAWATTWKDLKDHFASAGHVVRADVMTIAGGRSRGCGIVEFETPEEAANAIATLQNSELQGRQILVREDREEVKETPAAE